MRTILAAVALIVAAHAQARDVGPVFLQIYDCTDASLEDCQVYAVAVADGPRAIRSCSLGLPKEVDAWRRDGHMHVAGVCVDKDGRDVTDASLLPSAIRF